MLQVVALVVEVKGVRVMKGRNVHRVRKSIDSSKI
jgi:hypothetical protein